MRKQEIKDDHKNPLESEHVYRLESACSQHVAELSRYSSLQVCYHKRAMRIAPCMHFWWEFYVHACMSGFSSCTAPIFIN